MRLKSRVLLPASALAAAMVATACVPPPPPPPPTTSTAPPTTIGSIPGVSSCAPVAATAAGPDGVDPLSSWGVDGTAMATAIIGDVVYVGGNFANVVSPAGVQVGRTNLAAFCLADGQFLNTFTANFGGGPVNALATDGASLFVGGNFTTLNGGASNRLVKLTAAGARDASFNPLPIPAPTANPPATPPEGVLALAYSSTTGVLYAGGEFGKIGTSAGAGQSTVVDNAAGFNANGTLTAFTGGTDKKVESIAVSPDGQSVFMGGSFTLVHATGRAQLAKLDASGNVVVPNYGAVGARVFDIVATSSQDILVAVGPAIQGSGTGRRLLSFSGATPGLVDANPKGDVNAVEAVGNLAYFGMEQGYGTNNGPNLVGVVPTLAVGSAGYMPWSATAVAPQGVFDLTQGSNGRFVAVGDFTSVGTTGNLHGLAIFA